MFSSLGPRFVIGAPFISYAHISIAGSQIINNRLNALSMISCCFFNLVKLSKRFNNVNLWS